MFSWIRIQTSKSFFGQAADVWKAGRVPVFGEAVSEDVIKLFLGASLRLGEECHCLDIPRLELVHVSVMNGSDLEEGNKSTPLRVGSCFKGDPSNIRCRMVSKKGWVLPGLLGVANIRHKT
jgi:hypothetical protein